MPIMPIAGFATAVLNFLSKPEDAKKDNKIKKEDIKKLVLSSLEKTELELCNFFGLNSPDILKFLDNIDQGKPKDTNSTQYKINKYYYNWHKMPRLY